MLKNVVKEIERANNLICSFCGEYGASTGCNVKTCNCTYHFLCAKKDGCHFNWDLYLIHCKNHLNILFDEKTYEFDDVLQENERVKDIVCSICYSGLDEEQLVICDGCEKDYHTYCHDPAVPNVGDVDIKWYCKNCIEK